MAQVHYWELSNYNAGALVGKWFDLDGKSKDDHQEEINEWLEGLTESTGELCEEVILGDVEDVPSNMHGEYGIYDEFFELMEFMDNTQLDREVIEAAAELGIPYDKMEEAYFGEFESDRELGEYVLENGYFGEVPDNLLRYIDEERVGYDFGMDLISSDGHYFYANW